MRGHRNFRALTPLLASYARQCGQPGALHEITQQLIRPDGLRRRPVILLIAKSGGLPEAPARLAPAHLAGVVVLVEYVARPSLGLRVFASADEDGRANVLAPRGSRAQIAAIAGANLMANGAQVVQIIFSDYDTDTRTPFWTATNPPPPLDLRKVAQSLALAAKPPGRWSVEERKSLLYLPLLGSFEKTTARMSQKARYNLHYYRRRMERDHGCIVVQNPAIGQAEFLAFSRIMFKPVTRVVALQRWASLYNQPNANLIGIKDRHGEWLSLVFVVRQGRFARIDWLMNRTDLPHSSLANVARACVMEDEIARGSTRLYLRGGTTHPSGRSYLQEHVTLLTLRRNSLFVKVLNRSGLVLQPSHPIIQTLARLDLTWHAWHS